MDSTICRNPLGCYLHPIIQLGKDTYEIIWPFHFRGLESIEYWKGIREENNFLVGLVKVG